MPEIAGETTGIIIPLRWGRSPSFVVVLRKSLRGAGLRRIKSDPQAPQSREEVIYVPLLDFFPFS
jgi:hypothetical protein